MEVNRLIMSEEYTIEEIELTEDFGRYIYNWYSENYIVNHPLSRADYVRANNQRVRSIFNDLKELNYFIEERKHNEVLSHYGWLDDEAKELIPQTVIDHIKNIDTTSLTTDNDEDF
jgi:hypothetical protein